VNEKTRLTGRRTANHSAAGNEQPHAADARDEDILVEPDCLDDPLLAALAAAELDDEPITDDDRAAVQAGWNAYVRRESRSWDAVRQSLELDDVTAAKRATS
jgi:hypothetical protein